MSRLGNLIEAERIRRGLSPKQAAKLCGVSASYIIEVESGRRIIADAEAVRMLKKLGASPDHAADIQSPETMEEAYAAPVPQSEPKEKKVQPARPIEPSDAWLDALSNVVRRVAVLDQAGAEVEKRQLPVVGGRIEGYPADKVFYFRCPDDSMAGFRLRSGDLLLALPVREPVDGAIMVVSRNGILSARRIERTENNRLLLQSHGMEFKSETVRASDVAVLGRCIRAEIAL